jgi:hypothetical protein
MIWPRPANAESADYVCVRRERFSSLLHITQHTLFCARLYPSRARASTLSTLAVLPALSFDVALGGAPQIVAENVHALIVVI